jgi:2-polyprenyl-3-methyl-5-hydroxy-6-metoxy-1,4-benzoquinol methylase
MTPSLQILELPALPDTVSAGKIHFRDTGRLRHRACPICKKDDPVEVVKRPDQIIVHACGNCGMTYLAKVPDAAQLNAFYRGYANRKYHASEPKTVRLRLKALRNPHISILEQTGGIRGQSICELGCSFGTFLEYVRAKRGYPHGVEIDQIARQVLDKKRIPASEILPGQIDFDVICAFDLLEHLVDPGEMIQAVSGNLKQDGRFLLSVPNGNEIEQTGPTWIGLRVDLEHLNYFRLEDITRILARYNLYVEQYWEKGQPYLPRTPKTVISDKFRNFTLLKRLEKKWQDYTFQKGRFQLTILARKV